MFPSCFPIKPCIQCCFSPALPHAPTATVSFMYLCNNKWREVHVTQLLTEHSSPSCCRSLSLRPKCRPQHPNSDVRHPRCVSTIVRSLVYQYLQSNTTIFASSITGGFITTTCFGPICGPSSGCDWTYIISLA